MSGTPWQRLNRVGPVTCCLEGPASAVLVVKVYGLDGRLWAEARAPTDLITPAMFLAAFQRPAICLN